jgi:hypothetical protein
MSKDNYMPYKVGEAETQALLTKMYPEDRILLQAKGGSPDLLRYSGSPLKRVEGIEVVTYGEEGIREKLAKVTTEDEYKAVVVESILNATSRGLKYISEARGVPITEEESARQVLHGAFRDDINEEFKIAYHAGVALGLLESIHKKLCKWQKDNYKKCPERSVAVVWTHDRSISPPEQRIVSDDLELISRLLNGLLCDDTALWEGDISNGLHRVYFIAEESPDRQTLYCKAYCYNKDEGMYTQTQYTWGKDIFIPINSEVVVEE